MKSILSLFDNFSFLRHRNASFLFTVLIFSICLLNCAHRHRNPSLDLFAAYANDSLRHEIYKTALDNESTSPSYVVIRVTNEPTGEQKELCTEAPFLEGALHIEYGIDYDSMGENNVHSLALKQKDRSFKFSNRAALDNINFFNYPSIDEVNRYADALDLDYYKRTYSDSQVITYINFLSHPTEQLLFAHALFQCGIVSRRADIAGNILWIENPILNESNFKKNSTAKKDSLHFRIGIPRANLN